jgi:L-threonylcarbamoyladenylate synthase
MSSANVTDIVAPPFKLKVAELVRSAIAAGRVMTFPTETSYALGGNALCGSLVDTIYRLKGRDRSKPLLLLVDGSKSIDRWVRAIPPAARMLMSAFWPGPLTLVLQAGPDLPSHLPDERNTIAVRWSPHPVVVELLALGGVPLIGTSANLTGAAALHDVRTVLQTFPNEPLLAIDGGPTSGGSASTVLDTTVTPYVVVRPGVIPMSRLQNALSPGFVELLPG